MPVGDEAAKPGAGKRYNHHHHHHHHHTIVVVVVITIIIVVVVILIAVIIIRDFKQRRFRHARQPEVDFLQNLAVFLP